MNTLHFYRLSNLAIERVLRVREAEHTRRRMNLHYFGEEVLLSNSSSLHSGVKTVILNYDKFIDVVSSM